MSESFHWWDFLPLMKNRFPGDEIETVDIRGTGATGQQLTPLSVSKNIEALRAQVQGQGKKILVGFSLGGILALEWAHQHPDEVDSVVVINGSQSDSFLFRRMRPSALAKIVRFSLARDPLQSQLLSLGMTTSLPLEKRKILAEKWHQRAEEYPIRPQNFIRQMVLASRLPARKETKVPVLLVHSKNDQVVHPSCSLKIASRWKAPMADHPTAGHDITLEDPQWVLDQLASWIRN